MEVASTYVYVHISICICINNYNAHARTRKGQRSSYKSLSVNLGTELPPRCLIPPFFTITFGETGFCALCLYVYMVCI